MLKCFGLVVLGLALLALAAAREAPSRTQVTPPPAACATPLVVMLGIASQIGFALAPTRVDSAFAGRASRL